MCQLLHVYTHLHKHFLFLFHQSELLEPENNIGKQIVSNQENYGTLKDLTYCTVFSQDPITFTPVSAFVP